MLPSERKDQEDKAVRGEDGADLIFESFFGKEGSRRRKRRLGDGLRPTTERRHTEAVPSTTQGVSGFPPAVAEVGRSVKHEHEQNVKVEVNLASVDSGSKSKKRGRAVKRQSLQSSSVSRSDCKKGEPSGPSQKGIGRSLSSLPSMELMYQYQPSSLSCMDDDDLCGVVEVGTWTKSTRSSSQSKPTLPRSMHARFCGPLTLNTNKVHLPSISQGLLKPQKPEPLPSWTLEERREEVTRLPRLSSATLPGPITQNQGFKISEDHDKAGLPSLPAGLRLSPSPSEPPTTDLGLVHRSPRELAPNPLVRLDLCRGPFVAPVRTNLP